MSAGQLKKFYDADALAEQVAEAVVAGQSFRTHPRLGQVSDEDKRVLARATSVTVEEFNATLSEKLRSIANKAASRIQEKLDSDSFKPSELGFILAIAEDKRTRLDGTHSLSASSVNIQVNNFGPASKNSLLDQLSGSPHNASTHSDGLIQPPDSPK